MSGQQEDATAVWDRRHGGGEVLIGSEVTDADVQYFHHPFLFHEAATKRLNRPGDIDPAIRFMKPAIARMLGIGAGAAHSEEWLVRTGFVEHFTIYETSAVANAAALARLGPRTDVPEETWYRADGVKGPGNGDIRDRFEFHSTDALKDEIPSESFDGIFVHAAIHHFFEIEEMFKLMHRVLKPGGLFFFNEFVGPDRMIHDPWFYDVLDEIDACLSPEFRKDMIQQKVREGVIRPSVPGMLALDPSECVHSSRILPLTYQYFDVVERRDFGGTMLRPFFAGILRNFDFTDAKDQTIGRLIVLIETLMLRERIVPHDNTRIAARKRATPRPRLSAKEAASIAYEGWPAHSGGFGPRSVVRKSGISHFVRRVKTRLKRLLRRP